MTTAQVLAVDICHKENESGFFVSENCLAEYFNDNFYESLG